MSDLNISKLELLDIVNKALEIPQSTYAYLEDHTDGTQLAITERFIQDNISKRVLEQLLNSGDE